MAFCFYVLRLLELRLHHVSDSLFVKETTLERRYWYRHTDVSTWQTDRNKDTMTAIKDGDCEKQWMSHTCINLSVFHERVLKASSWRGIALENGNWNDAFHLSVIVTKRAESSLSRQQMQSNCFSRPFDDGVCRCWGNPSLWLPSHVNIDFYFEFFFRHDCRDSSGKEI